MDLLSLVIPGRFPHNSCPSSDLHPKVPILMRLRASGLVIVTYVIADSGHVSRHAKFCRSHY